MTAPEPFVSIVTPFYNTDPFIAECIESVLKQSYSNFEYILVDNQSTDASGKIAGEYAKKDSRVRLLRSPRFLSQLENFNFALEQISDSSTYVKFALADDWLFPRCLTEMVSLAETNPGIAVVSSYDLRETGVYGDRLVPRNRRIFSGREVSRMYLLNSIHLFGSPTTLLFRANVVRARKPFFEPGRLHSDTEVVLQLLAAHDFGFVHKVLTFMRLQDDSLSSKTRNMMQETLDHLINIKRFGRLHLDADEYERCLEGAFRRYYEGLAKRWLLDRIRKPKPEFWEYQAGGLASIGEAIQSDRMARAIGTVLVKNAINPRELLRTVRLMSNGHARML